METQGINLFIVDDNKLLVANLKNYLTNKFGISLQISTFNDGESCLDKVNTETHIVILDYKMEGKNGLEILRLIKAKNPKIEVIMLSGNEDIALAVETFRAGAKDYVIKGYGSLNKIGKLVRVIINEPLRILVKEFGVSKYMAAFLLTFIGMGLVVAFALNMMKR
ncbi:MAG: response regulator [Bacteroidota bacterium]|nr:response regulator [Bacteroidota bacterium]MDP3144061.1 response regulator [Bacteroidota bacterium]MDP3557442.1 response regulator [Bacteroidota bacterium]